MKKIIDAYTIRLFKENIMYLASFVIFVLLLIFILPGQIKEYADIKDENQELTQEVGRLERKKIIIESFNSDEIDRFVATLNALLPQSEDYFSVFQALNALSQQTHFVITGVSVSFDSGSPEDLALTVTAEGSPESFDSFLANYTYKSGRLITMDKVDYNPAAPATSLVLHFHRKKIEALDSDAIPIIDKNRTDLVRRISDHLDDMLVPDESSSVETDYPARDNPFGPL